LVTAASQMFARWKQTQSIQTSVTLPVYAKFHKPLYF
jgi:hypothetical protein